MENEADYGRIAPFVQPVSVNHAGSLAPINNTYSGDDIEVIDLDDPRGQIKPTTWHR